MYIFLIHWNCIYHHVFRIVSSYNKSQDLTDISWLHLTSYDFHKNLLFLSLFFIPQVKRQYKSTGREVAVKLDDCLSGLLYITLEQLLQSWRYLDIKFFFMELFWPKILFVFHGWFRWRDFSCTRRTLQEKSLTIFNKKHQFPSIFKDKILSYQFQLKCPE